MFLQKITTLSKIDDSGSDVYNRFEFQIACVFATFLKVSQTAENFYILLDYIDDFVVVDNPETEYETITFVQVKSRKGRPITLNTVVTEKWILKQAKNYESFVKDNVKNILLTNLGISTKSKIFNSLSLTSISALDIKEDLKDLKEQIFANTSINSLENFYIIRSSISIDSYETEIKGKMLDYANKNGFSHLTIDAIDAIYMKIWGDLQRKQQCVLSDEEKKNANVILEKKGLDYSRIKDIFRTTLDIQLPEVGSISQFFRDNKLNIGTLSNYEFSRLFRDFRVEAVKSGMTLIEECWIYLKENHKEIGESNESLSISSSIISMLDKNSTINSSVFYQNYKYCISTFFTYKLMEF